MYFDSDLDRYNDKSAQPPTEGELIQWTEKIISRLQELRSITTEDVLLSIPGVRQIPLDHLRCHQHCEVNTRSKPHQFVYIPTITRRTAKFLNNRHDLLTFLQDNPPCTEWAELRDAYHGVGDDLIQLHKSGLVIMINCQKFVKEKKEQAAAAALAENHPRAAAAAATKAAQQQQNDFDDMGEDGDEKGPNLGMNLIGDGTVIFPQTFTQNWAGVLDNVEIDEKYKELWRSIEQPASMTEVENKLKQENFQLLGPKAASKFDEDDDLF